MSSLTEYFSKTLPKPRYQFGDRVEGVYQGVPYVGTLGTDNVRNLQEGARVTIHLDLPLKPKDSVHLNFIRVQYKEIKGLRK
jgi:hypothetical protein